ncbi:hypothetical protein F4678DRAFT_434781 [Xylaria arbuscula]|nr:hypothetical protein F4678DRAFT_434781 [Xylaria arbuscula]
MHTLKRYFWRPKSTLAALFANASGFHSIFVLAFIFFIWRIGWGGGKSYVVRQVLWYVCTSGQYRDGGSYRHEPGGAP